MASPNFQALLSSWIYEASSQFTSQKGVEGEHSSDDTIGDNEFFGSSASNPVTGAWGDESNFWLIFGEVVVKAGVGNSKVLNVWQLEHGGTDLYKLGSYWYVVHSNGTNNYVYKYDSDFDYDSSSGDLDTDGNTVVFSSITHDGTYFYLLDSFGDYVYEYDNTWTYRSRYALDANNDDPQGLVHDTDIGGDGEFFVTDGDGQYVYYYNSSFTYQGRRDVSAYHDDPRALAVAPDHSFSGGGGTIACFDQYTDASRKAEWVSLYWNSSVSRYDFMSNREVDLSLSDDPKGITYYSSYYYVIETDPEVIVKYDTDFADTFSGTGPDYTPYDLDDISSGANLDPRGIYHDGTYAYVVDGDGNVYKYNLSTPELTSTNALNASNDDPLGLTSDGTNFYVMDGDGSVYKYNSSWTYQDSYATGVDGWGIEYDSTDTLFYIVDTDGNLYWFDTSFTQQGNSDALTSIAGSPKGLCDDGTYYNLVDDNGSSSAVDKFSITTYENDAGLTVSGHTQAMDVVDYTHEFSSAQTNSVLEIWGYVTDITKASKIILKDATGNECITVKFDSSKIYGDAGDTGLSPSNYTWYRFTIDFDCSANTYDLDVDGTNELSGQAFGTNDDGSGLTEVQFIREDATYNFYVAHLGEVWDADYTEGDNASDEVDITDDILDCTVYESKGKADYTEMTFQSTITAYFDAGHTVKFYDKDSTLSFVGEILSPQYTLEGATKSKGKCRLRGKDKQLDNVYRKNFTTARSSDYMLKNIIDNELTFYHSYDDEMDDFSALTFKYDLKKRIRKFIHFIEMLERAVVHYHPDGEFFFNAHDNLSATGFSWTHQTTEGVVITKYEPSNNRYITRAPVIGAHNSDGQVYVVGTGDDQTSKENTFGINQLQSWRDSEITNYSEANQLATNLQTIYSQDTKFITVRTQGKGHIQVGHTISFASPKPFEFSRDDFLVIQRIWYPLSDVCEIVLTDNILTKDKFNINVVNKVYDDEVQAGMDDSDLSESTSDGTVQTLKSIQEMRNKGVVNHGEFDLDDDLSSDHSYNGVVVELTNSQSFGDAVYISGNNTVGQADADSTGTMPCIGISVGTNKVLVWGVVRDDSWNWTAGDILYVSTTAGSLTTTAPSGSGDQVQVVGIAIDADAILVIPSMVLVEVT